MDSCSRCTPEECTCDADFYECLQAFYYTVAQLRDSLEKECAEDVKKRPKKVRWLKGIPTQRIEDDTAE